jgi:hypothetical protein
MYVFGYAVMSCAGIVYTEYLHRLRTKTASEDFADSPSKILGSPSRDFKLEAPSFQTRFSEAGLSKRRVSSKEEEEEEELTASEPRGYKFLGGVCFRFGC